MEIKFIEAFLKVVETGSFSTAAESMYLTQPTVSLRIRKLEEQLNTPLFVRNGGKKAILTLAGKKIYPYYKDGFQSILKGNEIILSDKQGVGKIRLSCPNHVGHFVLPNVLKSLYEYYSEIDFNVKVSTTDEIIEDIKKGETDVGIIFRDVDEENESYTMIPIAMEKSMLVAAPAHPLAQSGPLTVLDLKEEKFIVFSKTSNRNIIFDGFLNKHGLKEYSTIEIRNTEWLKNMVIKGIGISFLQMNLIDEELKNGLLVELTLTTPLPSMPISIIIRNVVPIAMQHKIVNTMKELLYS
jgi:DNA-binding transcriptional LysR family regulator